MPFPTKAMNHSFTVLKIALQVNPLLEMTFRIEFLCWWSQEWDARTHVQTHAHYHPMAGPKDKSHDPCHDHSGVNPWDVLGMIDSSQTICRYICEETEDKTS